MVDVTTQAEVSADTQRGTRGTVSIHQHRSMLLLLLPEDAADVLWAEWEDQSVGSTRHHRHMQRQEDAKSDV